MRAARIPIAVLLGLAVATAAFASPAEEHQAGLRAYLGGDVRSAISLLRKPADAGHGPSQVLLGEILDMAEQNEEAVKYFRLAADQGLAEGYFGLGGMFATGEGVGRDLAAARQWITRAAEAGHKHAVHVVAVAYMKGGLGIAEDERRSPEALQWIERAAKLDSVAAIDRLAAAFRQGELGLAPDAKKAEELEARSRELRRVSAPRKPAKKPPPRAHG